MPYRPALPTRSPTQPDFQRRRITRQLPPSLSSPWSVFFFSPLCSASTIKYLLALDSCWFLCRVFLVAASAAFARPLPRFAVVVPSNAWRVIKQERQKSPAILLAPSVLDSSSLSILSTLRQKHILNISRHLPLLLSLPAVTVQPYPLTLAATHTLASCVFSPLLRHHDSTCVYRSGFALHLLLRPRSTPCRRHDCSYKNSISVLLFGTWPSFCPCMRIERAYFSHSQSTQYELSESFPKYPARPEAENNLRRAWKLSVRRSTAWIA